jgi:hypothetical protein
VANVGFGWETDISSIDDRPFCVPIRFRAAALRAKSAVDDLPTNPFFTLTGHSRFELNPEATGAFRLSVLPDPVAEGSRVYRDPIPEERAITGYLQQIAITKTGSTFKRY